MTCDGARERIATAVLGSEPGGFKSKSLDTETKSHLDGCQDCRAFLDDLLAVYKLSLIQKADAERKAEALIASRLALPAIQSAIDEGLARRSSPARKPKTASIQEKLAFTLFAAVVLLLQILVFMRLRPEVVIGVQAGLNWLAPVFLYLIHRFDRRPRGREGGYR